MPIFKNKELLQDTFDKYAKLVKHLKDYANNDKEKFMNVPMDPRDLASLVFLLSDGDVEISEKEAEEKFTNLADEMTKDPTRIFNKVYDIYENFALEENNTETAKGIVKVLAFGSENQAFATILAKNPEYKYQRYGQTFEGQKLYDSRSLHCVLMNCELQDELYENNLSLSTLGKPQIMPDDEKADWVKEVEAEEVNLQKSYDKYLNGHKHYVEYNVGKFWADLKDTYKKYDETPEEEITEELDEKYNMYRYTMSGMASRLLNDGSFTNYTTKAINDRSGYTNIYINGKQLDSLIGKDITEPAERAFEAAKIFSEAVRKCEPIDIAQARVCNGETKLTICPIKMNYSKEATDKLNNDNYKSHSWFRRTFFNWGPFKIKTIDFNKEYIKNSDTNRQARADKITQTFEETIHKAIKANYDKVINEEIKVADNNNPNRNKYEKEFISKLGSDKIKVTLIEETEEEKEYNLENLEVNEEQLQNENIYTENDNVIEP